MRVTSGVARGKNLKTKQGFSTRPLLSRVRKSLFDILGSEVEQREFLDLYAGSGSVGIEALSRGASAATFVENDPECIKYIRENLFRCGFLARTKTYQNDVLKILALLLQLQNFSIVFVGPPYFKDLQNKTLDIIQSVTSYQGQIVIQHASTEKINFERTHFDLLDRRDYRDTCLTFLFKKSKQ